MNQMSIKRARWVVAVLAVACVSGFAPLTAGDGRIPIYQPVVIGSDGSYYLTSDITAAGIIIDVQGTTSNVVLDLNGKVLTRTDPGPVIRARSGPSTLKRVLNIHDGTVATAQVPSSTETAIEVDWHELVRCEDLFIKGTLTVELSNDVNLEDVRADSVRIEGTATGHVTGSIEKVTSADAADVGFEVIHGSAMQVNGLIVENSGGDSIVVNDCSGCLFSNITAEDPGANGVTITNTTASQWHHAAVVRAGGYAWYVDGTSAANSFTDINGSYAQNGSSGFENLGAQTDVTRGVFKANAGHGVHNLGLGLTLRQTTSTGNVLSGLSDEGVSTFQESGSNNFD